MTLSPRTTVGSKTEKARQKAVQGQAFIFNVNVIEPNAYTGKPMLVWRWADFAEQLRDDPCFIVKLETKNQAACLRKQASVRGKIRVVVRKVADKNEEGKDTSFYLVYREDSEHLVAHFDFYWKIYGALPMACQALIGGSSIEVPSDDVLGRVRLRLSSILRRDYADAYQAFHETNGGRASPVDITPATKGAAKIGIKPEMLALMLAVRKNAHPSTPAI